MKFKPKKVLAQAWEITQSNRKHLFWYGFLPSFFSIGVGAVVIYFQIILLKNSSLFTENTKTIIDVAKPIFEWIFSPQVPTQTTLITIILVVLASYILPVFSEGAIILMTKNRNKENKMGSGFGKGMSCFLPMFEFSLMQGTIKPYSMFFEFLFFARILGKSFIPLLKPIFFVVVILGSIALFFFSFVSQFIAIEKKQLGEATLYSLKFVSRFFLETMRILFLFLFIEIRTLFNVIIIFLLPAIIFSIGGIIAEGIFGIITQIIIAIIVLSFASSISGVLFVYKNIAWTLAFTQLKYIQEQEDEV